MPRLRRAGCAGALLTVELADGARLRFALVSVPDDVDGEVRVLRGSASDQLRARRERCERQVTTGDAMARYLLEHGGPDGLIYLREPVKNKGKAPVQFAGLVEDHVSVHIGRDDSATGGTPVGLNGSRGLKALPLHLN